MSKQHTQSASTPDDSLARDDVQLAEELSDACREITQRMAAAVVGQRQVIDELLMAVFSQGHCLLVGVPGLAKTLMIRTLARTLSLDFSRIQFTPDLMPSDITGTDVIQEDKQSGERLLKFLPGPVFANVVLADEINRTPPKTQAALLEAMQERQVSVGTIRHKLPSPFLVLATQNPIEQEGTYPLPEAQLDRFMFQIKVDYPSQEEELDIVLRTTSDEEPEIEPVLDAAQITQLQHLVRRVPVAEHAARHAVEMARLSRPDDASAPDFIAQYVSWGAGPRASRYLVLGAKARAVLAGRSCASLDDVNAVALPVLRHRILTNFNAEADGMAVDTIIEQLIRQAEQNWKRNSPIGKLPQVFGK